MAVALIYTEPEKGGRGKKSGLNTELDESYLSRARIVIKWGAGDLAPAFSGAHLKLGGTFSAQEQAGVLVVLIQVGRSRRECSCQPP